VYFYLANPRTEFHDTHNLIAIRLMTNPYESPITPVGQLTGTRRPWLICLMVTFAAILVWFSFLGIPIYTWLSVLAFVFIAPINSVAIAPMFAKLSGHSLALAIVLHVVVGLLIVVGPFYWPSIVRQIPSLRWTMYPSYLIFIWVPPVLFGSLWYAISWVKSLRRYQMNTMTDRGDSPTTT